MDVTRPEGGVSFSHWRPLIPAEVERVPDCPGIFELATLVRNVLFLGAAQSLQAALAHHLASPGALHVQAGRVYFRYLPTDDPEQLQLDRLEDYRRCHGGALPPAQSMSPPLPRPRRHLKAVIGR